MKYFSAFLALLFAGFCIAQEVQTKKPKDIPADLRVEAAMKAKQIAELQAQFFGSLTDQQKQIWSALQQAQSEAIEFEKMQLKPVCPDYRWDPKKGPMCPEPKKDEKAK